MEEELFCLLMELIKMIELRTVCQAMIFTAGRLGKKPLSLTCMETTKSTRQGKEREENPGIIYGVLGKIVQLAK